MKWVGKNMNLRYFRDTYCDYVGKAIIEYLVSVIIIVGTFQKINKVCKQVFGKIVG